MVAGCVAEPRERLVEQHGHVGGGHLGAGLHTGAGGGRFGMALRERGALDDMVELVGGVLPVTQRLRPRGAGVRSDARLDKAERGAGAVLRGCEVAGQRAGAGGEVGVPFALRAGAETVGGGARIAGLAADATDLVAELAQGGEVLVLEREVGQFADADLARLGLGDLVGGRVR